MSEIVDPDECRAIVEKRVRESDLREKKYFHRVAAGSKRSYGHQEPSDRYEAPPETENYGVHAAADDTLVLIDIDDHKDGYDEEALTFAREKLPETLTFSSAHGGEGRLYHVPADGDGLLPAARLKRDLGKENVTAVSWGEIRVSNQYIVAAGSQLDEDGCTKDGCDGCAKPDGGRYTILHDRPIASLNADLLVRILARDKDVERTDEKTADGAAKSKEFDAPSRDRGSAGTNEAYDALDALDCRTVAGLTIVDSWTSDHSSGDNVEAFTPIWGGADCSGTANVVGRDGWRDTGGAGRGGPIEMAAIASPDLPHDEMTTPGDVTGDDWVEAYRYLQFDAGIDLPPLDSYKPEKPEADEADDADWWEYVRACYDDEKGEGRLAAADVLENVTDWMYVIESGILWVYDDTKGYYNPLGESRARTVLENNLGPHYSKQEASEVIERLQARNQTRRAQLNARTRDSPLLCVANGVVNLENGELIGHSPEYKFTRGLQWDFDPENADTDAIVSFLDDITERECDRDTLLDHLAHGLMPGHPYRAFVMMYGPGSNGKTRVGKLFRGFVGEDNAASVELQDLTGDDSFATGGLPGAFINVGDDISVGEIRDTSIIKSLTGDGTVRANEKYEKQYEFENEAAMFFSANEPPRISEKTDAINDRLYPIKMPFRFVDNPTGPMEKQKIPGIAKDLINDDAAMRGLLALAVEHAQGVIERRGAYSLPEGPAERREMYEAASDPIKRFAIEHLQSAGSSSVILKDDAYTVYTEMCADQGERSASADAFKRAVGGLSSIDIESTRTRKMSPGDDREQAWRYAEFAESAKEFIPERLLARYFPEDAGSDSDDDDDGTDAHDEETVEGIEERTAVHGARPFSQAAHALTGYVTVTAKIATTQTLGDDGCKAILKDETGAMDFIAWDTDTRQWLAEREGECIVIHDAEVREYEGKRQLTAVEGLTEIEQIQAGVGYAPGDAAGDGQSSLENQEAAPDGGQTTEEEPDEETGDGDEEDGHGWTTALYGAVKANGGEASESDLRTALMDRDYDISRAQMIVEDAQKYGYLSATAAGDLEATAKLEGCTK